MNLDLFEVIPDPRSLVIKVFPIIDPAVRGMCALPYPGHRKGCPKFNDGHQDCPPDAPRFYDRFDIKYPVYAIVNEFDMAAQEQRMLTIHPNWSIAQARNCYYWQKGARKVLRKKVGIVLSTAEFRDYGFTMCPEGMGVNVTKTLAEEGIILEWPPVNIARQVALIGKQLLTRN